MDVQECPEDSVFDAISADYISLTLGGGWNRKNFQLYLYLYDTNTIFDLNLEPGKIMELSSFTIV